MNLFLLAKHLFVTVIIKVDTIPISSTEMYNTAVCDETRA